MYAAIRQSKAKTGMAEELTRRIKAAGFMLLGRTNTPEGGWCIATEPKLYGPTLNPWNPEVTPGEQPQRGEVALDTGPGRTLAGYAHGTSSSGEESRLR